MNTDAYLLVKEAAAVLGVAPNTVRAWAAAGKLREYRHPVNNYRLFDAAEVRALRKKIDAPKPTPGVFKRQPK
jgi:excisionase family DNA binding protein